MDVIQCRLHTHRSRLRVCYLPHDVRVLAFQCIDYRIESHIFRLEHRALGFQRAQAVGLLRGFAPAFLLHAHLFVTLPDAMDDRCVIRELSQPVAFKHVDVCPKAWTCMHVVEKRVQPRLAHESRTWDEYAESMQSLQRLPVPSIRFFFEKILYGCAHSVAGSPFFKGVFEIRIESSDLFQAGLGREQPTERRRVPVCRRDRFFIVIHIASSIRPLRVM